MLRCLFCRERVPFFELPATDYQEHLKNEHNVAFESDFVVERTIRLQRPRASLSPDGKATRWTQTSTFSVPPLNTSPPATSKQASDAEASGPVPSPTSTPPPAPASPPRRKLRLPWFSGSEYECRECRLLFFYVEDLRVHVRRTHCHPDQYLERHKFFETLPEYVRCEECAKEIKRSYFSCRNHLSNDHNMTLEAYEEKFKPRVWLRRVEEDRLDPRMGTDGRVDWSKDLETVEANGERPAKRQASSPPDGVDSPETKKPRVKEEPVDPPTLPDRHDDLPWYAGCEFRCKICLKVHLSVVALIAHLGREHAVSAVDYRRRHGVFETKSVMFRCRVCNDSVKHTEDSVRKHLECTHMMSLKAYEDTILAIKEETFDLVLAPEITLTEQSAPSDTVNVENEVLPARESQANGNSEESAVNGEGQGVGGVREEMSSEDDFDAGQASPSNEGNDDKVEQGDAEPDKGVEEDSAKSKDQQNPEFHSLADFLQSRCRFACKACGYTCGDSSIFWHHALSAHGLEKRRYQECHGWPVATETKLECPACFKHFLHEPTAISLHAREHGASPDEFFRQLFRKGRAGAEERPGKDSHVQRSPVDFTQDHSYDCKKSHRGRRPSAASEWSDQCDYRCKICGMHFNKYQLIVHHVRNIHNLSTKDYTRSFGDLLTERQMHQCKVCNKAVTHTYNSLACHTLTHRLTLQDYYAKHISNPDAEVSPQPSSANSRSSSVEKSTLQDEASATAGSSDDLPVAPATVDPDAWMNGCTYECAVCHARSNSLPAFRAHLSLSHGVEDLAEYVNQHGDPAVDSALLGCALCREVLNHDPEDIRAHLAAAHVGVSQEQYRQLHQGQGASENEVVALKAAAAAVAPRNPKSSLDCRFEWNHCVSFCPTCPTKFFSYPSMIKHLSKKSLSPSAGLGSHSPLHRCRLCQKSVKLSHQHVSMHLQRVHSTTVSAYEEQFFAELRPELERAKADSDALKHPGFDPNMRSFSPLTADAMAPPPQEALLEFGCLQDEIKQEPQDLLGN